VVLTGYASVLLGYANIFIATFILVYAYLFLQQTNEHRDRRPWDFLFIASLLYLVFQIFNVMFLSGITTVMGDSIDIDLVRNLFAFLYSGCVLLAFVSQHDLILRSHLILISKKDSKISPEERAQSEKK
jgi:predicted membrane metal-binding protein